MDVHLVLPCLGEREVPPWVRGRIPGGARGTVVDNGSTDGSVELAAALGATVVREPRRGLGAACHAGLEAATAPYVAFCDCEASLAPRQLERAVGPAAAGAADLVPGRRRPIGGAWPLHARALARLLNRRTSAGLRERPRAARREALLALDLTDRRFGYPLELVVAAVAAGWRITERDVDYQPRAGRSKVTGTVRGTLRTVPDRRAVLAK